MCECIGAQGFIEVFLEITRARCCTFSKGRRGKLGPADIGGVLKNHKGEVLYMFSKHWGLKTLMREKY